MDAPAKTNKALVSQLSARQRQFGTHQPMSKVVLEPFYPVSNQAIRNPENYNTVCTVSATCQQREETVPEEI